MTGVDDSNLPVSSEEILERIKRLAVTLDGLNRMDVGVIFSVFVSFIGAVVGRQLDELIPLVRCQLSKLTLDHVEVIAQIYDETIGAPAKARRDAAKKDEGSYRDQSN